MRDFLTRYGNWAVVAGASEGLGAAFATELAKRGIRAGGQLPRTRRRCPRPTHARQRTWSADVPARAAAAHARARARRGSDDVVAGGYAGRSSPRRLCGQQGIQHRPRRGSLVRTERAGHRCRGLLPRGDQYAPLSEIHHPDSIGHDDSRRRRAPDPGRAGEGPAPYPGRISRYPRERDDDRRCAKKYGPLWEEYRRHARWRIVPGIY